MCFHASIYSQSAQTLIAKNLRYCFAAKNFALRFAINNTKLTAKYSINQFGEHHGKTNDT